MSRPTVSIAWREQAESPPRRISNLIAELQEIQGQQGDLVVQAYSYSSPSYLPAGATVESDSTYGAFVLIEP